MSIAPFSIGEPALAQALQSSSLPKSPPKRRKIASIDRKLIPEAR